MIEHVGSWTVEWFASAWAWSGWTRLSEMATVVTAGATASIAAWLYVERWSQIRKIETYLKHVGSKRGPDEQGLRSAENISRKLGIPVGDVQRLAHASRNVVSRIRPNGPEQDHTLLWGHRRFIKGKK